MGLKLPDATLACMLTTAPELRRLNRDFADEDAATDVLAFPARSDTFVVAGPAAAHLGDLAIAVSVAAANARRQHGDATFELRMLAVHGLLHLLGHDHGVPAAAQRMGELTQELLSSFAERRGWPTLTAPRLQVHG